MASADQFVGFCIIQFLKSKGQWKEIKLNNAAKQLHALKEEAKSEFYWSLNNPRKPEILLI